MPHCLHCDSYFDYDHEGYNEDFCSESCYDSYMDDGENDPFLEPTKRKPGGDIWMPVDKLPDF